MQRIAVVTGSNGMLGRAIRETLSASGYRTVGIDIANDDGDPDVLACDLRDLDAIRAVFGKIEQTYGPVYALVNNAGITGRKSFFDITQASFDATIEINTRAGFFCSQFAAEQMMRAGNGGRIVSVASKAGQIGSAYTDYGMSKAAIITMTKSLGKELASHRITVNAVAPGVVDTAMSRTMTPERREQFSKTIPIGRFAEPQEIAAAVGFLVSDDAAYVTAAILDVNGGW